MLSFGQLLAIASSALLCCTAVASPVEEVFVNYGADPDSLWFSWATNSSDASVVQFGTSDQLGQSFTGPARECMDS